MTKLIPTNIFPKSFEKYMNIPIMISLITIFQGCFGGMGIAQVPQRLKNTLNHPLSRFIFVAAIAYTATKDLEISIVTTLIFFTLMYLLRTKEEQKQVGFLW